MLLLTHSHKSADWVSVADIAAASARPGLSTPVQWPSEPLPGLKSICVPMQVAHIDNQNAELLNALRRNEATGAMERVSMRKGLILPLSDFVDEHDFEDFEHEPRDPWRDVHRLLRADEGHADLEDATGNRYCTAFELVNASTVRCITGARIGFGPSPVRRRS